MRPLPPSNRPQLEIEPTVRAFILASVSVALSSVLIALLLTACAAAGDPSRSPFEIPGPEIPLDQSARQGAQALGQAIAALERGDLPAAQRALGQTRSLGLLADYAEYSRIRVLLENGRHTEAAAASRLAAKRYPESILAGTFSQLLGDALLAAGDEIGAREAWQLALDQVPDDESKTALRSAIAASQARTGTLHAGWTPEGADGTSIATPARIEPRPLDAPVAPDEWLRRADRTLAEGRSEEALALYQRALQGELSESDQPRARMQSGHCLFKLRRYEEARDTFEALTPELGARFWYARALARSGQVESAIAEFEAVAEVAEPELAGWSLYLAGRLLEDRGKRARAMALYREVASREDLSERALDALWRLGWSAYQSQSYADARRTFLEMAGREQSSLDSLRPRYWAARSAEKAGQTEIGRQELAKLAAEHPFSYYGWRATERLREAHVDPPTAERPELPAGSSGIKRRELERVALLLEAGLSDWAHRELQSMSGRALGVSDRAALGRLYVRAGDYHRAQRLVVDAYADSLARGVQPGEEVLWWLSWPPAYREIIEEVFPPNTVVETALVWAIMREESSYRPGVTSSAGARGLLQIMPTTGEQLARDTGRTEFDPDDLYQPRVNIELGTLYLDQLGRRFPGRLSAAISSYNAGPRAVSSWLQGALAERDDDVWVEDIPYEQTRSYVKRVLRSLHVYRSFYR
jgi:soluble lytic murein transglycosylase